MTGSTDVGSSAVMTLPLVMLFVLLQVFIYEHVPVRHAGPVQDGKYEMTGSTDVGSSAVMTLPLAMLFVLLQVYIYEHVPVRHAGLCRMANTR